MEKSEKINLKKLLTDNNNCGITNKSLEEISDFFRVTKKN